MLIIYLVEWYLIQKISMEYAMRKSRYVIIICLLFLFTLYFYVESNTKDNDILKLKEVNLKIADKYIQVHLPLKNIKGLDKNKSSYDIFKHGANPNVSSIIPYDGRKFMAYQDKLMMLNKPLYKTILKEYNISDNNIGSKIRACEKKSVNSANLSFL